MTTNNSVDFFNFEPFFIQFHHHLVYSVLYFLCRLVESTPKRHSLYENGHEKIKGGKKLTSFNQ
jgi:hypothetical protein